MPNANITVYLTDEEYMVYIKHKEELNEKARSAFKEGLANDIIQ